MEQFKEFQGKDLDECISQACAFFGTPREKLEIEIIQDAKSGIFGIVGARKAKIRARNAHLAETVQQLLEPQIQNFAPVPKSINKNLKGDREHKNSRASGNEENKNHENVNNKEPAKDLNQVLATDNIRQPAKTVNTGNKDASDKHPTEQDINNTDEKYNERKPHKETKRQEGNKKSRYQRPKNRESGNRDNQGNRWGHRSNKNNGANSVAKRHGEENLNSHAQDSWPVVPLDKLDNERLEMLAKESVLKLVTPMSESDVPVEVVLEQGMVRVKIDWQGDAGILIGKEGQTLAAIQYLAGRIVSKAMQASIRVQLEIGDYKSRQDDHLRGIALALADKARNTGRSWSTRPLSSYHRRIIHMTLQNESGILTRSAGEGAMKRVIISSKRD